LKENQAYNHIYAMHSRSDEVSFASRYIKVVEWTVFPVKWIGLRFILYRIHY